MYRSPGGGRTMGGNLRQKSSSPTMINPAPSPRPASSRRSESPNNLFMMGWTEEERYCSTFFVAGIPKNTTNQARRTSRVTWHLATSR